MVLKNTIVYSNVWEDPELNRQALQVKPGESVLSITSGGCNSLCLLLENPGRVVSIDLNPAQLAVLEFKRAAIMELEYEDFLEALGVPFYGKRSTKPPAYRSGLYQKIRERMPDYARDFWDDNDEIIRRGIFWSGKVEAFFTFYMWLLKRLYRFADIEALFQCRNLAEQRECYRRLNKKRWRFLNGILLNHTVLSLVKGRHSFAQVEDKQLSKNLSRKIDRGMTNFFNPDNYFMALMFLGGHFSRDAMAPYLLEANFPLMKKNIGNLEIYLGTCGDVLGKYGRGAFHKLNLSNIFEWMDNEFFNGVMREVIDLCAPGGRLCYRYTLAKPRQLDARNLERLVLEPEESERLFKIDRSFIYESFHVFHLAD